MKQPYLAKLWVLLLFALLGFSAVAQAQTGSVSGRVLDEKNTGIPGATVLVSGTSLGVSSDVDGNFRLANVPAGPQTIVLTFVGYNQVSRSVTIVAGQNVAIDAALTVSATNLGEAVVIGYGTQRKQDVTGAITTVSAKDFVQGQVTNPEQLIQGKVAGVQITTDGGAPGAGTTIRIRGGSSLNANNNPLIVIDGVPVDTPNGTGNYAVAGVSNPLSLINPNDIETYTVLKDASATAIYGSRASNGVILITTKKGSTGDKLTVNLVSNTSLAARYNSVPVLTADEFRATVQAVAPQQVSLLGTGNTDWQKQIFRNAMSYDNNVSLTGAVGKLPFRASIGNLEQQGILITNRLIRNSGSLSLNPILLDNHLRINANVKGTWVDNNFADAGAIGSALAFDPTQNVFSDNAAYGNYFQYLQGNGTPQQNVPTNPVATLMLQRNRSTVKRSIGNIQLDYKLHFLPDLHANLNLGYDVTRATGNNLVDARSAGSYFNNAADPANTTARGGSYNYYSQQRNNKLLEAYLNYTKQFTETSRLELLAGYSYQDFVTTAPAYDDYLGDATTVRTLAANNPFRTQYTILSYYGRANLTLNNRYIFTGTLRNDASSRFPLNNRNALFPAASFAWRLKEESFLKDSRALSDLKLRVGYGITGQQDVVSAAGSDYPYLQRFQQNVPSAQYQLGGVYYTPYSPLGYNSNLKWEQTSTYNAGLDFGFFSDRLTLSADAYYRKTTDLLAVIPIPGLVNFTNRLVSNVGSLENKGIELNLNGNVIQSEQLNWSVNVNATYNVNRILSLGPQAADFQGIENTGISGGTGTNIGNYRVGSPSSAFYVYQQAYGANGKPVDGVYVDTNGDGKIDSDDRRIFQQSAPKVLLGFGSNLSYNRLSLAFSLRANLGNYVYNNVNANLGNYQGIVGSNNFVSNVVRDANNTGFLNSNQARYSSDYYIQNASFLRMDNVTLGYNAGKVLNGKGSLRLSAAVQNVFVATKYTGLDPEIPNGVDNNVYPRPRTYTFGLNLSI